MFFSSSRLVQIDFKANILGLGKPVILLFMQGLHGEFQMAIPSVVATRASGMA